MPRISNRSIETLKHQVNLYDVVSPYVQLKRAGSSWRGLSPFTNEKTPSFYVHPDKGFFKCFSTGEGGDVFSFVQKMENLSFYEAVEHLSRKFNIPLEYEGGASKEESSLRKQLFAIHETAAQWFHDQFASSDEAQPVRKYWTEERGFQMGVAEEFLVGYAPITTDALAQECAKRGYSPAAMHASGLFFAREGETNPSRFRSFFRGRLMVAIRDVQGRVVAFTARQLAQTPTDDRSHKAKYINSRETPIFHKGRVLFGMDHARKHIGEAGDFLLVEGQLDAIRCWSEGLHTAVAPQGTGITEEQLELLRRYQPKCVYCLLDGDAAGRKAALKIAPMAVKIGLEVRYLLLPEGCDPDDLLKRDGRSGVEALLENAIGPVELTLQSMLPGDRSPSTAEKTQALQSVYDLTALSNSEVARDDYIQIAARITQVNPASALSDFKKHTAKGSTGPSAPQSPEAPVVPDRDALLTPVEWELLWLALHHPETAKRMAEAIDHEWVTLSSPPGSLLAKLLAELSEGLIEKPSEIEGLSLSPEEKNTLAEIHFRDLDVEDPQSKVENCITSLHRNYLTAEKKHLEQSIANVDPSSEDRREMMLRVRTIRKTLSDLARL